MAKRPRAEAPKAAVIYLRVSTREQGDQGVGLAAQEARCRAHAARLGLEVLSVHCDVQTGKDALEERPGLQAAVELVRSTPGAVLVAYSVSRVARRQRVLWHILDDRDGLGVPLSSATEPFDTSTPIGRAMLGMLAVWAQLEADMISERTKDALAAVRASGVKLGGPEMTSSEAKRDLIRQVQTLSSELRLPLRSLCAELAKRGIQSVNGARWHPRTLRKALAVQLGEAL